jgi:glycosyltransferase involved in cell wall biosynthesis
MRIGYLCSDFDVPLYGDEGCSIHVRDLAEAFVDAGHEVFVVCASLDGVPETRSRARVYHVAPQRLNAVAWELLEREPLVADNHLERDLRLVLYNTWLASEGAAILAAERPDLLYERYALFGWGGATLARAQGIPHVLEVNAPLTVEQEGYEKFTLTTLAEQLEAEVFRAADAVVAVSGWLRDWIVERGVERRRVHVVPNGVSRRLFGGQPGGDAARARFGLDGNPVIGFVGSFQPWHDVAGLLQAFARLHAEDGDLRLLIVGEGEARRELEATARDLGVADAAVFTGHLPHEHVPAAIAAMDVAVAPYDGAQELGFLPLKLFEYMASGKPTVAAAVGQIPWLVEDGITGLLYPPGDDARLAGALRRVLYSEANARALGLAAREKVLREHTWDSVAERIVAIARPLVEGRR